LHGGATWPERTLWGSRLGGKKEGGLAYYFCALKTIFFNTFILKTGWPFVASETDTWPVFFAHESVRMYPASHFGRYGQHTLVALYSTTTSAVPSMTCFFLTFLFLFMLILQLIIYYYVCTIWVSTNYVSDHWLII
jgi:hypothetical protein